MAHAAADSKSGRRDRSEGATPFDRTANGEIHVTTQELRNALGTITDAVVDGDRCLVTRFGRDRMALVPMRDFERLLEIEKAEAKESKGRRRS